VAKSANLLVDGYGSPEQVGLLLPPHWQTVCLLFAGVTTGAAVVVADGPQELAGCGLAFVSAPLAGAALDAGVDDVLALSGHPLGAPAGGLPAMVTDYAREVPSYGDSWTGALPSMARVEVGGGRVEPAPAGLSAADRVLWALPHTTPASLALLLGCLRDGAALVLVPDLATVDVAAVCAAERVTATAGADVAGLPRLR
jgi:uncharacterized protein (TIGR03089 family)